MKSREVILDILDEALVTFDDIEEDLNDIYSVGSNKEDIAIVPNTSPHNCNENNPNTNPLPSEKPNRTRSWKKPEGKPKRPLSAYNLFFQFEREHIIAGGTDSNRPSAKDIFAIINAKDNRHQPKKKRLHRKTHGKVSFGNLARTIAYKWKTLDKETKAAFQKEASLEKARYKKEVEEWEQDRNEKNGQIIPIPLAHKESVNPSGLISSGDNRGVTGPIKPPPFMKQDLLLPNSIMPMNSPNPPYCAHEHKRHCKEEQIPNEDICPSCDVGIGMDPSDCYCNFRHRDIVAHETAADLFDCDQSLGNHIDGCSSFAHNQQSCRNKMAPSTTSTDQPSLYDMLQVINGYNNIVDHMDESLSQKQTFDDFEPIEFNPVVLLEDSD